ncbi:MAG: hypothetical protein IPL09_11810 [Bacteroidetes bacterium]|nr:hypothetical protein [Bacteroidota bacterium]
MATIRIKFQYTFFQSVSYTWSKRKQCAFADGIKSFDGKKLVSSDELTWTTNSESNNAYFNLQHSTDGVNFETIAKVNSKAINGNSSTDLQYHAVNNHPVLGHNYYRLQQIDIDNKSSVHAKMVDLIWGANGSTVNIYPNPTRDMLNIDLYTSTEIEYYSEST